MALRDEINERRASKLAMMGDEQQAAQSWIEAVTGKPFEAEFAAALKDGKLLCELANTVKPGCIKKVNASALAFKQMENISHFIRVAKAIGVPAHDCFDTVDLYQENDMAKVIQCLHAFGGAVQKEGIYNGPTLGTAIADKNKREFTPEQLAAGKAGGTLINAGSSAQMERSGVVKTGITFGNDNAGSGDAAATTAVSQGSAGVMDRSGVTKSGITFGNDNAGSGDTAAATAVSQGSAGVMDRSGVTKSGITFGNDQSGGGDAGSTTAASQGSAGVMDRSEVGKTGITFGSEQGGVEGGGGDDAAPKKPWTSDGAAVEDSNMANVGSQMDKDARKGAAEKEPAWAGCGAAPGLEIWRIEKFKVVPWPKAEYGNFYDGDSYIVLSTTKPDPDNEKLVWDIHFWLGEGTSTDEKGTAAYKTVELDDLMDGAPIQHREVMSHESQAFGALFEQGVHYMEGGVDSGFHHVEADAYIAKLLQVRKTKKHGMKVAQVPCTRESLNAGDCFVLDAGAKIYVWCGDEASAFEKRAAGVEGENLEQTRLGKAECVHEVDDKFWALLGGEGEIKPASAATDDDAPAEVGEGVMYKLSDEGGELMVGEVARGDLKLEQLDTNEVMLVDASVGEMFVWVGAGASDKESRNALATAESVLKSLGKPAYTPIHLFKEGQAITDPLWISVFA